MAVVRLTPVPHLDFVRGVHLAEILANVALYVVVVAALVLLGAFLSVYTLTRDWDDGS